MPARFWVPLDGVRPPVPGEYLHAAISRWFDEGEGEEPDSHHAVVKPYTISPVAAQGCEHGVEVSVLSRSAAQRLLARTAQGCRIRLGTETVRCGSARLISSIAWQALQQPRQHRWTLTFLTPTTFRTGNRSTPLPTPSVVLRAPTEAWARFSALPPLVLSPQDASQVWVSALSITSSALQVNGRPVTGVLGDITYRCDDTAVAATVGPLFRLAPYCGVGSFRGKGFGVVELSAA